MDNHHANRLMVFVMTSVLVLMMDALIISCVASLYLRVWYWYLFLMDRALQGRVFVDHSLQ